MPAGLEGRKAPKEEAMVASSVYNSGFVPFVNKRSRQEEEQEAAAPGGAAEPQAVKPVHIETRSTKRRKFDASQIRQKLAQVKVDAGETTRKWPNKLEHPVQGRADLGKEIAKAVASIAGAGPCRKVLGLDIPGDTKDFPQGDLGPPPAK